MKILRYILASMLILALSQACAGTQSYDATRSSGGLQSDGAAASDMAGNSEQMDEARDGSREAGRGEADLSMQDTVSFESEAEAADDSGNSADETSGSDTDDSGGADGGESDKADSDTGTATDSSSDLIPEGWPEYIPIMEGFSVRYAGSDEAGMQVVAMADIPSNEVEDFYRNLPEWEAEPPRVAPRAQTGPGGETPEDAVSFQLTREHEILTVNIVKGQEETILQLMYTKL